MDSTVKQQGIFQDYLAFFFIFAMLVLSFFLLADYGLFYDSVKNFSEGQLNLSYLLHRQPLSTNDAIQLSYQIHGALHFMIGEVIKIVLSDQLKWLPPLAARHAMLPLLIAFFMVVLYLFLRKHADKTKALLTVVILWTVPRFFGEGFNNIKDITLFVFLSLSLFFFYEWLICGGRKVRHLYAGFVCWGLALVSKVTGIILLPILFLWYVYMALSRLWPGQPDDQPAVKFVSPSKIWIHVLLGCITVGILLALFFMPAVYGVKNMNEFFTFKWEIFHGRHVGLKVQTWNIYSLLQILFTTPLLVLFCSLVGIVIGLWKKRTERPLVSFFLVWLFISILAPCTPFISVYNGLRLFLYFLVPFIYFSAEGIVFLSEVVAGRLSIKKEWVVLPFSLILIGGNVYDILTTHPYEITYFNSLAGGLGGAQQKKIIDARDYSAGCYKEAIEWMNAHAEKRARLFMIGSMDYLYVKDYFAVRPDIHYGFIIKLPLPRGVYVILPKGGVWAGPTLGTNFKEAEKELKNFKEVYQIKRQGGEILTIYYKP